MSTIKRQKDNGKWTVNKKNVPFQQFIVKLVIFGTPSNIFCVYINY